jgi:hypothetical protein
LAKWLACKEFFIPQDLYGHQGFINIVDLWTFEQFINPSERLLPLLDHIMSLTCQLQALDLRYKVYGILGLTKYWWWETKIPVISLPDYTKSVQRVAQDRTLFMIRGAMICESCDGSITVTPLDLHLSSALGVYLCNQPGSWMAESRSS